MLFPGGWLRLGREKAENNPMHSSQVGVVAEKVRSECYGTAAACSASTHRAARPGPTSTFAGNCSRQRGWAAEQRGAKEQLWGFSPSEGGVPGMVSRRCPRLAPWMVE